MRSLIAIALCFVLASARQFPSYGRNRFQNLINRYQRNQWDQSPTNQWDLFGSDDVDDYIDDYVDQIRRERMFERDQCPRDFENILGLQEDELEQYGLDDLTSDRQYATEDWDSSRQRGMEDWEPSRQYGMEDLIPSRQYLGGDEELETRSPLLKEVKDANLKLATRLYEQCKNERDDKNTAVSPISIQLALATLNWGARGNTRRQIGHVIGGRLQTQERKQVFRALVRHLKGLRNIDTSSGRHSSKINCVTGLFVSKTTPAQQMFVQQVKSNLGSTVKHCSFPNQPQQCRQMINQWMSQKTHGKINRIVPQDAITDNTKMVLVNGLEMKAQWGQQMRRHVTKEAKFYPLDTKKVKVVEVMETEGRFKYYEDELVKIVGVPTKEQELTLYTIVPKDKDGLTDVEKLHLQDSVQLKQLLNRADKHVRRVQVQLPKFQIKHKIDVRRTLRKQGVTDAFDPQRADFSGITGVDKYQQEKLEELEQSRFGRSSSFLDTESEYETMGAEFGGKRDPKLHLNKFIHQCTIKITENGITATTGNQMEEDYEPEERLFGQSRLSGRRGGFESEELDVFDEISGLNRRDFSTGENVVKANRAFAFVVKHNPTNQLIMVGRVIDAAQKKVNHIPQTINTVDQF